MGVYGKEKLTAKMELRIQNNRHFTGYPKSNFEIERTLRERLIKRIFAQESITRPLVPNFEVNDLMPK